MEYLEKIVKKTGWISLVESIVFAIIGIVLIQNPQKSITVISYVLGVIFILIGVYKILVHLSERARGDLYDYGIVFGIMAVVIGIITIVFSKEISTLFAVIVGVWIIYSGILRLSSSLKLRSLDSSNIWIFSLVLSILMIICGIYIVANAGALIATIGVFILIYSVMDIIENVIFLKNVNNDNK